MELVMRRWVQNKRDLLMSLTISPVKGEIVRIYIMDNNSTRQFINKFF